jgi:hypothetical protein
MLSTSLMSSSSSVSIGACVRVKLACWLDLLWDSLMDVRSDLPWDSLLDSLMDAQSDYQSNRF